MKTAILCASDFLPKDLDPAGLGLIVCNEWSEVLKGQFDKCVMSFHCSQKIQSFTDLTAEVRSLGVFDTVVWKDQKPWPEINLKYDLQNILAHNDWSPNRRRPCFLWGDDLTTRWMVSFVLQSGFKHIVVFMKKPDWASELAFPNVKIEWLEANEISSMGTVGGIFLTHFENPAAGGPNPLNSDVFDKIKYMHFLEDDGYFIDLSAESIFKTDFLTEAHSLSGKDLWTEILKLRQNT